VIADVVLLAADKTIDTGITKIFGRSQALGCRAFSFRSFVHVARDPGCYRRAQEFLAPVVSQYGKAIVVFDFEGSGAAGDRSDIESEVEGRLAAGGWNDRAVCVVVDPEIENWIWSDSPHVADAIGCDSVAMARQWLSHRQLWPPEAIKPPRPKEALEAVLRERRRPRSSALYGMVAERVSLARCTDPAFLKLRDTLRAWFPAEALG
jgi:hypothetical protein